MGSGQHQRIMNSGAMQNLHNTEAMRIGDIDKMQEAINSNPEVKEETLNQMNQFMQENGQTMSQMMQAQNLAVMNQMMNGQNATGMNQMMDKFQGQKGTPYIQIYKYRR
ncbi:MAG TPA: hypothetical protein DEF42_10840 [Desulfosporosinus sp.]|nr:hypothetical protein [Desulfosporosinus sp.]